MSNSYFKFKQFTVEQKLCANKVSTDACVFGAFLSKHLPLSSVLDVGTGSALLSLMMAQGEVNQIIGVEIEENCFQQAQENVKNSPFDSIIFLENADIRDWKYDLTFDFIISNPPFFNNTSKNADSVKNIARQTEILGPKDWKDILEKNANPSTQVLLLLSNNDVLAEYEKELKNCGYAFQYKTMLYDKSDVTCKRVILHACQNEHPSIKLPKTFTYKKDNEEYTAEFTDLLKDFYLYL